MPEAFFSTYKSVESPFRTVWNLALSSPDKVFSSLGALVQFTKNNAITNKDNKLVFMILLLWNYLLNKFSSVNFPIETYCL